MKISEVMLTLAAFVIIIAGMKSAAAILDPFLLSAFIAIISTTPMFWLQKRGVPQALSLMIVLVGIITVIILVTALIGKSIAGFTQDLPVYQEKIKIQTTDFLAWLNSVGVDTKTLAFDEMFDPGAAMQAIGSMLRGEK